MSGTGRSSRWSRIAGAPARGGGARARVVAVDENGAEVELARGARGVIAREELAFRAGRPLEDLVGATLRVVEVPAPDDEEREVACFSARAVAMERCRRALAGGRVVRGRVVAAGATGLLVDVGGARGFVPASALPEGPRPAPGDRWRGRVAHVAEHLCVLGAEPSAPGPGGVVAGVVEAIGPEGAWLRLDGAGKRRALAVADELGWTPRPRVAVGDALTGAVLDLTMAGPRVSVRALQPSPWPAIALELPPGTAVVARVLATWPGGAHLRLADQPHAEAVVTAAPDGVRAGDLVRARVADVNPAAGQLALTDVTTGPGPRRGRGARTA